VLVPVVFALHNAEPNYGAIHLAEGLVVPRVGAGVRQSLFIDHFERLKGDVQPGFVWIGLRGVHGGAFLAGQGRATLGGAVAAGLPALMANA